MQNVARFRNRLKALWWDHNGYTLLYKRLSRGTFVVPEAASSDCACLTISSEDLRRLLAGLSIGTTTPPQIIQ
jgi:transposase